MDEQFAKSQQSLPEEMNDDISWFLGTSAFETVESMFSRRYNKTIADLRRQVRTYKGENERLRKTLGELKDTSVIVNDNFRLKRYVKVLFRFIHQNHSSATKKTAAQQTESKQQVDAQVQTSSNHCMNRAAQTQETKAPEGPAQITIKSVKHRCNNQNCSCHRTEFPRSKSVSSVQCSCPQGPLDEEEFKLEVADCMAKSAEQCVISSDQLRELDRVYEQLGVYEVELRHLRRAYQQYKTLEEENEMLVEENRVLKQFCPAKCRSAAENVQLKHQLSHLKAMLEENSHYLELNGGCNGHFEDVVVP